MFLNTMLASALGFHQVFADVNAVSFVQTRAQLSQGGCTTLVNEGTFFSLALSVGGISGGPLKVVLDTGSDSTVIPSCSCSTCGGGKCDPDDVSNKPRGGIEYGSGKIEVVAASDTVTVGTTTTQMHESLLLMTKSELPFHIDGILGLGPKKDGEVKSFMEEAGLTQFTVCFSHASTGKLILGASIGASLGSIGVEHWGLGLNSISVGSSGAVACKPGFLGAGSVTPCGAIPDSGSTLISGPSDQIDDLLDGICDNWSECTGNSTALVQLHGKSKASMLRSLVEGCKGLESMPSVSFSLTGSSGQQTIEISPSSYVLQVAGQCQLAFDKLDYVTQKNGPVWILGMPLFFEYNVGYDVAHSALAFKKGSCGSCGGNLIKEEASRWEVNTPFRKSSVKTTSPL